MKTEEQIKNHQNNLLNELKYAVSFEQVKYLQGKIAGLEWALNEKRSFEE